MRRASSSVAFSSSRSRSSSTSGVAEERVVVEAHLGVERQPLAVLGQDQRVDLGQRRVLVDVGVVERLGDRGEAGDLVGRRCPSANAELPRLVGVQPEQRVGLDADDLLRPLARDLFDVDAALGAGHHDELPARPVEDDAEVELLRDLDAGHDQHLVDGVTADVHAEDLLARRGAASSGVCASLMPPALPRPPVWTCALIATSPPKRSAIAAASSGVVATSPGVDRDAVPAQDLGRLVLVDIHRARFAPPIRPRTPAAAHRSTRRGPRLRHR